jgi:hypothetical protein
VFLDLLAGGGLLAAGYLVGYLTARPNVSVRCLDRRIAPAGTPCPCTTRVGAPIRPSVRPGRTSGANQSAGTTRPVPASVTSGPGCPTCPRSTARRAVGDRRTPGLEAARSVKVIVRHMFRACRTGHSRLLALIPASVVAALAGNRIAALATSVYRAGVVTVTWFGQTILITAGMSAG